MPVVPVSYGTGWALARDGLLGRRPERARHHAPGRPGVGAVTDASRGVGRLTRVVVVLGLLVGLAALGAAGRRRGRRPTFGTPTVAAAFGEASTFSQPVTLDAGRVNRVELLVTTRVRSGPLVIEVPTPSGRRRARP